MDTAHTPDGLQASPGSGAAATGNQTFLLVFGNSTPAEARGAVEPRAASAQATDLTAAGVAQWGLASLLVAGLSVLLVPLCGIFLTLIPMSIATVSFWDRPAILAAEVLVILMVALGNAFNLFILLVSLIGWRRARSRRLPRSLHALATLVSFVGMILWLIGGASAIVTAVSLRNIHH